MFFAWYVVSFAKEAVLRYHIVFFLPANSCRVYFTVHLINFSFTSASRASILTYILSLHFIYLHEFREAATFILVFLRQYDQL
jgi:hypothetical protein